MKIVKNYNFPKEIFGNKVNPTLLWEVIRTYLINSKHGKASTKTRVEVSGGGRKPYRQKGTGRARAGTIRSPLWRGGGVVFGPRPGKANLAMPKKKKKKAFLQALSELHQKDSIKVIEELTTPEPKTRLLYDLLKSLEIEGKKALIVVNEKNRNNYLAVRNIPDVDIGLVDDLDVLKVLKYEYLIFTKDAIDAGCRKWLGGKGGD